jgi:hypothetical protein
MTKKKLPSYTHVPGKTIHPYAEGGHSYGFSEPVAEPIDLNHPFSNESLIHGIELFRQGYFWESHLYFEALWNAHERSGPVADLMKAFVKLAAAGVKRLNRESAQEADLLNQAQELIAVSNAESPVNSIIYNRLVS